MFRISRIINNEFTVTVDLEIFTGDIENPTATIEEATARYRTNSDGQGLWKWAPSGAYTPDYEPICEWQQVLGTEQFDMLSVSDTRGYLIRHFIETPIYGHSYSNYSRYLSSSGERPETLEQARGYYRYLKANGLAA